MAVSVTCDLCKTREALGKVRVVVEVENATPAGRVTGRMEEFDSCEGCRERGVQQAFDEAMETLFAHIPVQTELHVLKDEITDLRQQRETHANVVDPLRLIAENVQKEHDAAATEVAKLANDPSTDPATGIAKVEGLTAIKARLELLQSRIAHHEDAMDQIDSALGTRLSRRSELHEATK